MRFPTRIQAVLFDLDGVLIDSEQGYTRFWESIDAIYPTGVPDFARVIKGTTLPDILTRYFNPAVHDDITERGVAYEAVRDFPQCPGARDTVKALDRAGIPMAVVTSSLASKMERIRAMHHDIFDHIEVYVTSHDITRSKPDPEGYLLAARRLGADPHHCFVVEDSVLGLRAGRAAGAHLAGITATLGAEAIEAEADIAAPSLAELNLIQYIQTTEPCPI